MMKKKKPQNIKIYGFPFPQQLLEDLRSYQSKNNISFPASAYATLICVLKQIHREKTTLGELQDLKLSAYSKELNIPYSTLYTGLKFLEQHGFVYEAINNSGKSVFVLHNFNTHHGKNASSRNYFNIPHSLFDSNIMAELVRTSNAKVFELLLNLLTQFRHGVAKVDKVGKVEEIVYDRTMKTLKEDLGKRSKGVRDALTLLEPLFNIKYVGLTYRQSQLWVKKIEFSLKPHTVIENTDAFEVNPLVSELHGETELLFDRLAISYKPRDLFDIMVSLKDEVINVLKYISNDENGEINYSERDANIQSFYYRCLHWFERHIVKIQSEKKRFYFSSSIGAYFRTIFRNHINDYINTHMSPETIVQARFKEYRDTGKVPTLYQKLTIA